MKQLNRIILSCVFFVSFISISYPQSKPLSKVYDLINGNEYGAKLLLDNKGYFLLTNGICDPGSGDSKGCTSTLSLNIDGELLNNKTFVDWFRFAAHNAMQKTNDTIIVYGINFEKPSTVWNIYHTNFYGDSLSLFTYEDFDVEHVVPESMQIKDGYLYLLGRTFRLFSNKNDIVVLKVDKKGNKIREERFYNIADPEFNNTCFDIVQTQDGNFVLSGRNISEDEDGKIFQAFIIKFNDNLETIWSKKFNRVSWISNEPHLTSLKDGGVVVNWGVYLKDLRKEIGSEVYEDKGFLPAVLFKIDKDGNTEWTDTMWTIRYKDKIAPTKNIIKLISCDNGDFVGCGYYEYSENNINNLAYLFRYNSNGKLLWEKKYTDQKYIHDNSLFIDVKEADNGDLVCTGELDSGEGWGNNDSYTWLLRVDRDGCFEPGCGTIDTIQDISTTSDYITGVEEVIINDFKNDYKVRLYPNPASNTLTVELPIEYSKQNTNNDSGCSYKVWSTTGILVKEGYINQKKERFYINVLDIPSGFYLLEIKDNQQRMLSLKKFVVE